MTFAFTTSLLLPRNALQQLRPWSSCCHSPVMHLVCYPNVTPPGHTTQFRSTHSRRLCPSHTRTFQGISSAFGPTQHCTSYRCCCANADTPTLLLVQAVAAVEAATERKLADIMELDSSKDGYVPRRVSQRPHLLSYDWVFST